MFGNWKSVFSRLLARIKEDPFYESFTLEYQYIFNIMLTFDDNIAVTGISGCGKHTVLNYFDQVMRKVSRLRYYTKETLGFLTHHPDLVVIDDAHTNPQHLRYLQRLVTANDRFRVIIFGYPNWLFENYISTFKMQCFKMTHNFYSHDRERLYMLYELYYRNSRNRTNAYLAAWSITHEQHQAKRQELSNSFMLLWNAKVRLSGLKNQLFCACTDNFMYKLDLLGDMMEDNAVPPRGSLEVWVFEDQAAACYFNYKATASLGTPIFDYPYYLRLCQLQYILFVARYKSYMPGRIGTIIHINQAQIDILMDDNTVCKLLHVHLQVYKIIDVGYGVSLDNLRGFTVRFARIQFKDVYVQPFVFSHAVSHAEKEIVVLSDAELSIKPYKPRNCYKTVREFARERYICCYNLTPDITVCRHLYYPPPVKDVEQSLREFNDAERKLKCRLQESNISTIEPDAYVRWASICASDSPVTGFSTEFFEID